MAKKKTSKANDKAPDDTLADKAIEAETESTADQKDGSDPVDAPKVDAEQTPASDTETPVDAAESDIAAAASKEVPADATEAQPDEPGAGDQKDNTAAPDNAEASETDEAKVDSEAEATVENVPGDSPVETSDPVIPEPATLTKVEQVVVKKGGFFPMLLGGIAAGAIGFAAAYLGLEGRPDANAELGPKLDQLTSTVASQAQTVDGISTRLDALPPATDLSPIEGQISDITARANDLGALMTETQATLTALSTQLDGIDARLTQVEQQPITQDASEAAVAAYERALKAAQDQIAQQSEDLRAQIAQQQDAMQAQRAELEALIAEAISSESEAEEAAMEAMRRAAISRTLAAIESGAPFANALSDLESTGMQSPEALTMVADEGAPSAAALQDSFPDAARLALSASRSAAVDNGETGGFSGFLRSQLGARSLEPREGNDPDAVLSRAEAAVREGRLKDALAEIEALPEPGKAVLSDWIAQANRRLDAMNAAQDLSEKLN